jgi:hypothetical protein
MSQTISHYAPKAHPPLADKIIDKSRPEQGSGRGCSFRSANGTALGEVPKSPTSVFQRMEVILRIPLKQSESGRRDA